MRKSPVSLAYEISVPLTNTGPDIAPRLLRVLGWLMSVRSRTTYELLRRSVTRARHRFEGGGQGLDAGVGLAVGDASAEGEGDGAVATVGEVPQADASSAVTARNRIQSLVFIFLQR
jgi:hypothetical protein